MSHVGNVVFPRSLKALADENEACFQVTCTGWVAGLYSCLGDGQPPARPFGILCSARPTNRCYINCRQWGGQITIAVSTIFALSVKLGIVFGKHQLVMIYTSFKVWYCPCSKWTPVHRFLRFPALQSLFCTCSVWFLLTIFHFLVCVFIFISEFLK